jgi:hypothetical protein
MSNGRFEEAVFLQGLVYSISCKIKDELHDFAPRENSPSFFGAICCEAFHSIRKIEYRQGQLLYHFCQVSILNLSSYDRQLTLYSTTHRHIALRCEMLDDFKSSNIAVDRA